MFAEIILITIGIIIVSIPEPKLKNFLKTLVEMKGLKPHITKTTIKFYRLSGFAMITIGIIIIVIDKLYTFMGLF